ncbi:uncharacterized protein LOC113505378 [Trichoplusia ni]|uniref:Uncharacterized protein LOC113505378 n=1 Tax=Trichoplusia ni TaxID=7111 RepID=A0A7E5WSS2_TRINI|nr:uncharacterized protein LOC113505378 [Trichoplusia ni]
MGVSARITVTFLLISAVTAVPTGDHKKAALNIDDTKDLNAESSEIISEAVAPPAGLARHYQEPEAAASDDQADHSIELVGGEQNFFPSFANLFEPRQQNNNFRLGFNNQEAAYSQRPNSYRSLLNYPLFGGYRNADNFAKQSSPTAAPLVEASPSLLGSGNFGIIRGGTFLAQNDDDEYGDGYNSYYNNGHGRPSYELGYIANPRPNYNQDQFANFRDFADINTPSNSAYSHFVVVYANKNATMDEISEESRRVVSKPKNIIETLESIDKTTTTSSPKISKAKSKLAATKQKMLNKKEQWKKTNSKFVSHKHDAEEPLLALS